MAKPPRVHTSLHTTGTVHQQRVELQCLPPISAAAIATCLRLWAIESYATQLPIDHVMAVLRKKHGDDKRGRHRRLHRHHHCVATIIPWSVGFNWR